jgi:H+/Cl- antiporter ClcA
MILATATQTGLTLADYAVISSIIGVVGGLCVAVLNFLINFLNTKFKGESKSEKIQREQSEACRFDHAGIQGILTQQNVNIIELLKQNSAQIAAFREATHASELRHQIVLQKLERIWDHLPKRKGDDV